MRSFSKLHIPMGEGLEIDPPLPGRNPCFLQPADEVSTGLFFAGHACFPAFKGVGSQDVNIVTDTLPNRGIREAELGKSLKARDTRQ